MEEKVKQLEILIEEGSVIFKNGYRDNIWPKIERWEDRCENILKEYILNSEATRFKDAQGSLVMGNPDHNFREHMKAKISFLTTLLEDLKKNPSFWEKKLQKKDKIDKQNSFEKPLNIITKICSKFHIVAEQLKHRHSNRETLKIKDEYDVQDLIFALLKLYFDDIRPEEVTPSYAGGSSRMDFLLKNENIVIEVKKTRDKLRDKEIGNQLIEDITRYQQHPNCRLLFCFVYDPDHLILNPSGLENHLNTSNEKFEVNVFITPKGH